LFSSIVSLEPRKGCFVKELKTMQKKCRCALGILNAKFQIFEGPIYCKETVNSIINASVVLHSFIRTQEGLFCEGAENYAVNQSSHHILNEDKDRRRRLSRAQHLRDQLADYFLTPAGEIPSQRSYIN
jgi:hypothetical protein